MARGFVPSRRQAAFSRVGVIPSGAFSRRQIRDLEIEVGVPLLERRARGIELTPAGRVFLDYAQLALLQVETAGEAARRVAQPEKASFVLGFLIGHEVVWLPETLRILRQESPDIEITLPNAPPGAVFKLDDMTPVMPRNQREAP